MDTVSTNIHKKVRHKMDCFYSDHITINNCYYYGKHESRLKSILSCKRSISSDNILLDAKSYENIFIYDISSKTLIRAKHLRIRFDQRHKFIRIYDETRYLVLYSLEKYNVIQNRIRYH